MSKKVGLIILDGWGIGDKSESDAIYNAKTPCMDSLLENHPNARLTTFGKEVGLPKGQMGNSEVGHLNIGAGRIVYQELTRINKAIQEKTFFENTELIKAFSNAKKTNKKVHFIGLVSEGGVHSSQKHLYALCDMAKSYQLENVFIHAFTDGRDCDPKIGKQFLIELSNKIEGSSVEIATIIGRYFAMDRDNRWERIKKAYDLMVHAKGQKHTNVAALFDASYASGVTDEFIAPSLLTSKNAKIEDGDTVICFNFRTDRPREISIALTQKEISNEGMKPLDIDYYTMTSYDDSFQNVNVIFTKDNLQNTLGEVLSKHNKKQVRIAETEKYPHVTFFFSGGRETEFSNEKRILINSPKVATYDLQPEMSAYEVTEKMINEIQQNKPDFFCLNFANPDMVGHTGVYEAIQKAVETVDKGLCQIIETGKQEGYSFIVIADHGNADFALNPDGSPNTAHSLNPVPIVLLDEDYKKINDGKLADIAPTILDLFKIEAPEEMDGVSLI